jgi:hypothetical protein
MSLSTLRGYPRIGGVIGYGPTRGSGIWTLQERYALEDDSYDDVSLLLHMNGSNGSTTFLDSSRFGHAVTANGNAQISTAQSRFGGASAAFDGSGDRLSISNNSALDLGSGDFCIEAWAYFNVVQATEQAILGKRTNASVFAPILFGVDDSAGNNRAFVIGSTTGSSWSIPFTLGSINIPINTWTHMACVRVGTEIRVFVNGELDFTITGVSGALMTNSNALSIGASSDAVNSPLNGYIDDLRITKGRARYEAAFTPRQRAFIP